MWALVDEVDALAGVIEIPARLAIAVAFLAWLHRASKNAHALADAPLRHSTGAAIGVWFIPIANLWMPFMVVNEIDRASGPDGPRPASRWTAAWWAAWIGGNVGSRVIQETSSESVGLLLVATAFASAVLAIVVVERIQRGQIARARRSPGSLADVFA